PHHAHQTHHADGGRALRSDHARGRRVQDREREAQRDGGEEEAGGGRGGGRVKLGVSTDAWGWGLASAESAKPHPDFHGGGEEAPACPEEAPGRDEAEPPPDAVLELPALGPGSRAMPFESYGRVIAAPRVKSMPAMFALDEEVTDVSFDAIPLDDDSSEVIAD